MKANHLKEQLSTRGLPVSGTKAVIIERLTASSNGNMDTTDISKIVTPLPVTRANNNVRNSNRRDEQGHVVPVNLEWIPLDQDKNSTTTSTNNFSTCDPIDSAASRSCFMQRNNYSKRHNIIFFQRKIKNMK